MQRRIPKPIFCLISLFLAGSISGLSASGNSKTEPSPFVVHYKKDLLTVKVKNIPLRRVLKEIADQALFKVIFQAPSEELVSVYFSGLSLEQGLKRLTRDFSYVLICGPRGAKYGEAEIREIIIFPKPGKASKTPQRRVIAPQQRTLRESEDATLDSLFEALKNKDPDVREEAVDSLAELKGEKVIYHLTSVLFNDEDEDVRASAAEALGDLGGERVTDPLIQALEDKDAWVRESAVDALANANGEGVIPHLMGALRDSDEDVREAAADALKEITGKDFDY